MCPSLSVLAPLPAGAVLGIVALGSPLSPERYAQGREVLEQRGYTLRVPLSPSEFYGDYRHGFANGSPQQRRDAFQSLLADPAVAAVITARGGYGALDVLPLLDLGLVRANPKAIVGISDTTALLVQGPQRFAFPTIHGPTLGDLIADQDQSPEARRSVDRLFDLLSAEKEEYAAQCEVLRPGSGEGPVIAGNLTMLTCILGTPWDIDYQDAVLVLEDVGEAPFQVHRSLLQLALAGKLDSLQGLVLGRFSRCEPAHGPTVEEVVTMAIESFLSSTSYPIVRGLPFGHWGENHALPLGCTVRIVDGEFKIRDSVFQ